MIKKLLTYGIGSVGSAVIGILVVPFLTRILSPAEYGKGTLFITIIYLLFCICNIGLVQGYERFYYDKNYAINKQRLFFQTLSITLSVFCFVSFVMFFFKDLFLKFFFQTNNLQIFYLLILALFFYILNTHFILVLRMKQQALLFSFAQIFNGLIYFGLLVLMLYIYQFKSYLLMIYSQVTMLLFVSIFTGLFNIKNLIKFKFKEVLNTKELKTLLVYSWPFFFSFTITWGMQYIDRIFLIQLSSFTELGIYSASFILIAPLLLFQNAFAILWVPIGMNLIINHSSDGRLIYSVVFKNITSVMFICIATVYCFRDFIPLFLGDSFSQSSGIFIWLLFIPLFTICDQLLNAGIFVSKKTYWSIVASICGFITNILLCLLLIPTFGAEGAAIALVIGNFIYILIKMLSCNLLYKYHIDYIHFFFSLAMFTICLILSDNKILSWFVIGLFMIYQILKVFNKTNVQYLKYSMKVFRKIDK
ncbi:lipopolysaccharide biosynthesis protein [Francisella philomiragia]|uniref:lipopolysaccharide biosynthesis protein n=1 Tax=Francisella philomiragia TaxID=28110 RepID=UPI001907450D|nr:polysaccharide biosynthesis C-terminal domain-containing protein [Francisella philomiragia]MBK2025263.1 polysaccharide biosynthesis C-terminal domain-containing protein [Francisella philomiragia]